MDELKFRYYGRMGVFDVNTEVFLELSQTSTMELFCQNS